MRATLIPGEIVVIGFEWEVEKNDEEDGWISVVMFETLLKLFWEVSELEEREESFKGLLLLFNFEVDSSAEFFWFEFAFLWALFKLLFALAAATWTSWSRSNSSSERFRCK